MGVILTVARSAWTTPSPSGLTLPPQECTWADPPMAGGMTEEVAAGGEEIGDAGVPLLTGAGGPGLLPTGEGVHLPTMAGETTGAGAGASLPEEENIHPEDTESILDQRSEIKISSKYFQ